MSHFQLTFDIQSDWHIGNGEEAGAYADAVVLKDNHNLPFLPGKSVKGLLRNAFNIANENNWFNEDGRNIVNTLFGNENREGLLSQGVLQVSNAILPKEEKIFLKENITANKHLYRVIQFTAIDHKSGVASESSLRSMEVVVPMLITAELNLNINHPLFIDKTLLEKDIFGYLENVVPLISGIGAKRHRGFGKVNVTVQNCSDGKGIQ